MRVDMRMTFCLFQRIIKTGPINTVVSFDIEKPTRNRQVYKDRLKVHKYLYYRTISDYEVSYARHNLHFGY
jgi:hypothetical protein